MEKVYRLTPTLQDNLWGGNRLREYGKTSEKDRIAESWELSFVPGNEAKIEDGRTTTEAFPSSLLFCPSRSSFRTLLICFRPKDYPAGWGSVCTLFP